MGEGRNRKRSVRGRVTLADVATRAGISTASVSRALNTPALVTADMLARATRAAAALQYRPNVAARSLAGNSSQLIGIIVPTISNSIFSPGVQAIEETLEAGDYGLVITTSNYDADRELAQVQRLISRGVDGLILVGTRHRAALYDVIATAEVPTAIQGAFASKSKFACIGFDNRRAMSVVAEHIFALGHRTVAVLAGISRDNDRVQERVKGVRDVAAAHRVPKHSMTVLECAYDVSLARLAAAQLLALRPRPTAIICINDILAIGAVLAARDAGLRVPSDLSVTGFDDFDVAATFDPPITTMRVPVAEMGQRVAAALLARLKEGRPIMPYEIDVSFVERHSTGPIPRVARD